MTRVSAEQRHKSCKAMLYSRNCTMLARTAVGANAVGWSRTVCPKGRVNFQTCTCAAEPNGSVAESTGTSGKTVVTPARPTFELACPICNVTGFRIENTPLPGKSMECHRCGRSFPANESYVDLTLTAGAEPKYYRESVKAGTSLFTTQAVSYIYERGYRQMFTRGGFPGVDKEFENAMEYFQPVYGDVLVDVSCGTGMFSRKFASSGKFSGVIASDYSGAMLKEAKANSEHAPEGKGEGTQTTPVLHVRADVGRLPFKTGSVGAVHAAAALHCWPSPLAGMAEVSRILKPGGVFVGSTVLTMVSSLDGALGKRAVSVLNNLPRVERFLQIQFFTEDELREIAKTVGLQNFQYHRSKVYIMFSATKPNT